MKRLIVIAILSLFFIVTMARTATMELYGNFNTMGVIIDLETGDDPDDDAIAVLQFRQAGAGNQWLTGHPLSRVSTLRFTGSLFWLEPATQYEVKVTFDDPDGALHGVFLELASFTRMEIQIPPPVASFYVSPLGTGSDCTEGNPCNLVEALDQAQAGDEIVLIDGEYYIGEISLPRSGTAGSPIVIRAADDSEVWLNGAEPASFSWSDMGNGVYQTTLNAPDTHLVMIGSERIYPYQSYSDLESLIWGLSGFYCNGTSLAVKLNDGSSPADHSVTISRFNHAFYVDGVDYLCFDGIGFKHFGCGSYAKAIYLNNASHHVIQNCIFRVNDLGVGLKRDSHRNVIQHCSFNDTIFDWPWDAVKSGAQLETGGIRFYSPCTGRGTVIRYNSFSDYFDGFGVCPGSTAGETNETDVYWNHAIDIGDDCIETDGECANVRIWDNTFENCLVGISLAPVYTGPVYAIRNLIVGTGAGNNDYPGSPFKFNSGYDLSGPMFLYHNTSVALNSGCHGLDIKAPGTWTKITARNNIWRGTDYGMRNYNTSNPIDLDYNNISTTGGPTLVRWDGVQYTTLAAFSAATGQEIHGFDLQPEFQNPSLGDYELVYTSQLIDVGIPIPGINDGFLDLGPDVGAFETWACCPDGDTNQDRVITAADAQLAFLIALGAHTPSYYEECSADCNDDGAISAGDAQAIFLVALGMGSCVC